MQKAYSYRLYPNKTQEQSLSAHFGSVRFVYNRMLDLKKKAYEEREESISCFNLIKKLPEMKEEFVWLKEINAQSLQMSIRNLDNAYTKFFREKKGFPRFKSKRDKQSYQCPQGVRIDQDSVKLPKIGLVKFRQDRKFEGTIKTCTVSKTTTGKFFISMLVDDGVEAPQRVERNREKSVGIDLGIKDFATLSTGEKIENPKFLRDAEPRIKVLQRRVSHKMCGSKNRAKSLLRLSRYHEKVANRRKNFLNQLSTRIVREFDTIVLEDLHVSGMLQNHCLAKSIQDASWREFRRQIEYKSQWNGKNFETIDRFAPSSRRCDGCGEKNTNLTLKDRDWTCSHCNKFHEDRDQLAARNIVHFAFA